MSKNAMNLTDLKYKPASELVELGEKMGIENLGRSRKQDIIFSILKEHAKAGENIYGVAGFLPSDLKGGHGILRRQRGSSSTMVTVPASPSTDSTCPLRTL